MSTPRARRPVPPALLRCVVLSWLLAAGLGGAQAEKADRAKPMVIEADKPGTVDLQRQIVVFNGNVVITQGTMEIRAERVELRELPDGFRAAAAVGSPGKPASYRQKRDAVDETLEGRADRIEYDSRSETLRFVGNGAVRRLRGGVVADEITGALITWDSLQQLFSVQGGVPTASSTDGRVRAVLSPPPAAAASTPR